MELLKFLTNLSHIDSHALNPFGPDLKAYILEPTGTWHVQHEFSDCRCDTVFIWYNDNFLTRGWNKKPKQLSGLAPRLNHFRIDFIDENDLRVEERMMKRSSFLTIKHHDYYKRENNCCSGYCFKLLRDK